MGLHSVAAGETTLRRLGRVCATKVLAGGNGLATDVSGWSDDFVAASRMSALGHKRTFAVQKGMSALPPKADIHPSQ
jgi:hypothetical protein